MAIWKLTRQTYGSEEYILREGDEVTIGRGFDNTISLSSIVISRKHCLLNVFKDKVTIRDLQSSNGTYLGTKKILPNTAVDVTDSQIIGLGWTENVSFGNVENNEKFIFKLCKGIKVEKSIKDRLKFQNELDHGEESLDDVCEIKPKFDNLNNQSKADKLNESNKPNLKRKLSLGNEQLPSKSVGPVLQNKNSEIINLLSDSDNEVNIETDSVTAKKVKLEVIDQEQSIKKEIKTEFNEDIEYEAFNVKQEHLSYEDEPINIDSDDSESESERRWFIRLSQCSPGPPSSAKKKVALPIADSSYTVLDDNDDSLLNPPAEFEKEDEFSDDMIKLPPDTIDEGVDEVDNNVPQGISSDYFTKELANALENTAVQSKNQAETSNEQLKIDVGETDSKKAQLIEPIAKTTKKRHSAQHSRSISKSPSFKSNKSKKHRSKRHISNSQKEERKKKLKEIATRDKDKIITDTVNNSNSKSKVNIKVGSNRGAFLSENSNTMVVKPVQRNKSPTKQEKKQYELSSKTSKKSTSQSEKKVGLNEISIFEVESNIPKTEHTPKPRENKQKDSQVTSSRRKSSSKDKHKNHKEDKKSETAAKEPKQKPTSETKQQESIAKVKPFTDSENSLSGKPVSKVEPLPPKKPKKTVRFSEAPPEVRLFEIEPGNQMKRTSLVKATLLDVPQTPSFSLEKITLMRILRWNPHWLEEQIDNNEPPPILGHNKLPLGILNYFQTHTQYVQVVGDLLLMEIWECMTQAYMRKRNQENHLQMSLEGLPPLPSTERCLEMYSISVNMSVLKTETKSLPRIGELILVTFGPENLRLSRFFYVNNIRCLPSPPQNVHSFFSISLHTAYTDKMKALRPGEVMYGKTLSYIKNELSLFKAMENLARSPLSEAILRPKPQHYAKPTNVNPHDIKSQWTATLNPSQVEAVSTSVAAALSDRPAVQLIQGPPGTGKSSVICSIVMTYFYDTMGRRRQNRGKLLICATSNAAVDELVIRLLNIRQNLPKAERFRMVRVGRVEAMHARARDLSSQTLAARDAQRAASLNTTHHNTHAIDEEIGRQEARLNMWKSMLNEAKDPARAAYCQTRIKQVLSRIDMLRRSGGSGGGSVVPAEQLGAAERRIIEGADILVTTLASAANDKMQGVRRRIALCIVDEAGQAIEPETLVPLTLEVTKLTLIGDPQQLPGYICSQRAKQHGLGESLFSRLSGCMESWNYGSPIILLNTQYRMHPEIADYPNRAFYDGRVMNATSYPNDLNLPPYMIVGITSGDRGQVASGANEMEAWGVSRLVLCVWRLLRPLRLSLAVITPYNAHKEAIRRCLRMMQDPDCPEIEVSTVDSSQGQERDVVLVSLARSQGVGFLSDAGRMNVMLTRARRTLLLCLNTNVMHKHQQWRTLLDDAQKRRLVRYLPNKVCQPATAAESATDNLLTYLN